MTLHQKTMTNTEPRDFYFKEALLYISRKIHNKRFKFEIKTVIIKKYFDNVLYTYILIQIDRLQLCTVRYN